MIIRKSMCLRGEMIEVYSIDENQAKRAEEFYVNNPKQLCFQCKYFEWKVIPPHVLKNIEEWKRFMKKLKKGF